MKAQRRRRARPPHRGEDERIAERRLRAFELRKRGTPYREIARTLGVDVHTVHSDVEAEYGALRATTVDVADDLRRLELERLDVATRGLWGGVERGDSKSVIAAMRVSERRARLLGLDAPTKASVEVTADTSPWPPASELYEIGDPTLVHEIVDWFEGYCRSGLTSLAAKIAAAKEAVRIRNRRTCREEGGAGLMKEETPDERVLTR